MVAGHVFGMVEAGAYVFAYNLMMVGIGTTLQPLGSIVYPLLCSVRHDRQELQRVFLEVTKMASMIAIPACVGLACIAPLLVPALFGPRWASIVPLLQILVIMPGLTQCNIAFSIALKAIGRPDVMPKFLFFTIAYSIPAYIVGAQFGLVPFTLARASVGLVFLLPVVIVTTRILGLRIRSYWRAVWPAAAASLVLLAVYPAAIGILACSPSPASQLVWLGTLVVAGVAAYGCAIWVLDSSSIRRAKHLAMAFMFG